jgi:hypothetical protein
MVCEILSPERFMNCPRCAALCSLLSRVVRLAVVHWSGVHAATGITNRCGNLAEHVMRKDPRQRIPDIHKLPERRY